MTTWISHRQTRRAAFRAASAVDDDGAVKAFAFAGVHSGRSVK